MLQAQGMELGSLSPLKELSNQRISAMEGGVLKALSTNICGPET